MSKIFNTLLGAPATFLIASTFSIMMVANQPGAFNGRRMIKDLWAQPLSGLDASFIQHAHLLAAYDPGAVSMVDCRRLVHECGLVDELLTHFFVPFSHDHLAYIPHDISAQQASDYQPLFAYWKERNFVPLSHFYVMYFDCVSRLFVAAVNDAYAGRNGHGYSDLYLKAEHFYLEMVAIMNVLEGTVHEKRYVRKLNGYYDLLQFMQAERHENA